ncbi:hypothetical protein Hdeb2414_s0439g00894201 [Helianthus debilis subsp. tardiflorus]
MLFLRQKTATVVVRGRRRCVAPMTFGHREPRCLIFDKLRRVQSVTSLEVAPLDLQKLLNYPPIYIHENGQVESRNGTMADTPRV